MESNLRISKDTMKGDMYTTNKPSFKNDISSYVEFVGLTKNIDVTIYH